jgi:type VI secretion system protein ImpF
MAKADRGLKARASLIDRLVDFDPEAATEARPLRLLSFRQIKAAIARDLSWLFNTRTPLAPSRYDQQDLTVIDYGIPDFGATYTADRDHQNKVALRLKRAISTFEPRLTDVRVSGAPATDERTLRFIVDACIVLEHERLPVSFATILDQNSKTVRIDESG